MNMSNLIHAHRILRAPAGPIDEYSDGFNEADFEGKTDEEIAAMGGDKFVPDEEGDDGELPTRDRTDPSQVKPKSEQNKPEPKKEEPKEEPKPAPKEEPKDEPKDEDKPKGVIPVDRHQRILDAERARRVELERQVAAFQGAQKVTAVNSEITALETQLSDLEEKREGAMVEGDRVQMRELSKQIRTLENDINDRKSDMKVAVATATAVEQTRYSMALERVEENYPELNPDNKDEFDKDLMADVVELKEAYQLKNLTPTDALQKAVRVLIGARTAQQKQATTVAPRVAEKDIGTQRKENAVDKALKTAQPANLADVGKNSDQLGKTRSAKDVLKMSDAEFDKLTDEELAEMGGDKRLVEEDQD